MLSPFGYTTYGGMDVSASQDSEIITSTMPASGTKDTCKDIHSLEYPLRTIRGYNKQVTT